MSRRLSVRSFPELFLGTNMRRVGTDGDPVECDMIIFFRVVSYSPGRPAQLYGEPGDCYPAEPPEYEFEVDRIEFDSGSATPNRPPDDDPGPLTPAEDAMLREWFDAHYDLAFERAVENQSDEAADRADYEYDRRRDEQMERSYRRIAE